MTVAFKEIDQAKVAILANPAFVDVAEEYDHLRKTLLDQGHKVKAFTDVSAAGFEAALAGRDVLVVPELFENSPPAALEVGVIDVLKGFVAEGGTVVFAGTGDSDGVDFINTIFNLSLDRAVSVNGEIVRRDEADGTTFADDPAAIGNNNGTSLLVGDSVEKNTLTLYGDSSFNSAAVVIPFGAGQIVYLGWDWFDAKPEGTQNGGWLKVLKSAISRTDGKIVGTNQGEEIDPGFNLAGQAYVSDFNDHILAKGGADLVSAAGGDDVVKGGDGNDIVDGEEGDDRLYGDDGRDQLWDDTGGARFWGGDGKDGFGLSNLHTTNRIEDFEGGKDTILLDATTFGGLPAGDLDKDLFRKGEEATTAEQRFIYDKDSGRLYYDGDGSGLNPAYHIATLKDHPSLGHHDFEVIHL